MICSCPKCNATTELDLPQISEEGTSAKCPECNARFWISKASFARRAVKQEGKTLCYHCNKELSTYLDCPTCGVMYPDLCIVQISKPVRRKQRKTSAQISFSIRPQRRPRVGTLQQQPTQRTSKSRLTTVAMVALVAVLVVAAGAFFLEKRAEEQYAAGFFRALLGIKLGTEMSFKQCAAITAAGKAKLESGQNAVLTIGATEKSNLDSSKSDIDTLMQKLPKTPQKFTKANENLSRLYGIYSRSYTLATSPAGSVSAFADSASKLENEFRQTAQEFKAGLPPGLAEKFQKAQAKYKEFRTL